VTAARAAQAVGTRARRAATHAAHYALSAELDEIEMNYNIKAIRQSWEDASEMERFERRYDEGKVRVGRRQCDLLRDLVPHLLRTASAIDPSVLAWSNGTVGALAQVAYENRLHPSGIWTRPDSPYWPTRSSMEVAPRRYAAGGGRNDLPVAWGLAGFFMRLSEGLWYRKFNYTWYVTVRGEQIPLGKQSKNLPLPKKGEKDWKPPAEIMRHYHKLMAGDTPPAARLSDTRVIAILDLFLEHSRRHNAPRTYY
jgi:hypothetical protein